MRTRLITSLAILDGLLLLFLSLADIKQLRQDSEQVQRLNTYLNTYYHMEKVEFVSSPPASADNLVWTRTWTLSVAGAALIAVARRVYQSLFSSSHPLGIS